MNINELTIGQAKELSAMFGNSAKPESQIYQRLVGKKVIVRSRNEGLNFGEVVMADETGIALKDARRIHYYDKAADGSCWYEGMAVEGPGGETRMSTRSPKSIIEDYSVTECSEIAIKKFDEWKDHEG